VNSLSDLSVQEWQQRRQAYVSQQQTDPVAQALSPTDWHLARAADAEQDRNGFAASWHLTRLIERDPDDWTLRARLARALMWQDDYVEATKAMPIANSPEQIEAQRNWQQHALANEQIAGAKRHVEFLRTRLEE
jgi:Flp pilus assembly protein TadD